MDSTGGPLPFLDTLHRTTFSLAIAHPRQEVSFLHLALSSGKCLLLLADFGVHLTRAGTGGRLYMGRVGRPFSCTRTPGAERRAYGRSAMEIARQAG